MGTFWLKVAVFAVVTVAGLILLNVFLISKPESKPKFEQKTFSEVIAKDDERLRAEPEIKTAPKDPKQPAEKPQFEELNEIQKIEAERLFEYAIQQRKIGRLPGPGYKPMVDTCRQMIEKFPGSIYEYKAKRMLADIPEGYREKYKITDEEIDLSGY